MTANTGLSIDQLTRIAEARDLLTHAQGLFGVVLSQTLAEGVSMTELSDTIGMTPLSIRASVIDLAPAIQQSPVSASALDTIRERSNAHIDAIRQRLENLADTSVD